MNKGIDINTLHQERTYKGEYNEISYNKGNKNMTEIVKFSQTNTLSRNFVHAYSTVQYSNKEPSATMSLSPELTTSLPYWGHCTVLYITVQYSTVQYSTIQYSTVQYSTIQYSTVQYNTVQYSTVQYSTVQYSTVQYNTVQCTDIVIFPVARPSLLTLYSSQLSDFIPSHRFTIFLPSPSPSPSYSSYIPSYSSSSLSYSSSSYCTPPLLPTVLLLFLPTPHPHHFPSAPYQSSFTFLRICPFPHLFLLLLVCLFVYLSGNIILAVIQT